MKLLKIIPAAVCAAAILCSLNAWAGDLNGDAALCQIVLDRSGASKQEWNRSAKAGMTLEDFLLSKLIIDRLNQPDGDLIGVYRMRKAGRTYEKICEAMNIQWPPILKEFNDQVDQMKKDAEAQGLTMWRLNQNLKTTD